jgi:hypothetical protein
VDVFCIVEYSGFRIHPLDAMTFPRFYLFRELRTKKSFVISNKALLCPAKLCRFRQGFVVSGRVMFFIG